MIDSPDIFPVLPDDAQTMPVQPKIDWLKISRDAYHSSKPYLDSYQRPQWDKNLRQWQGKHKSNSQYESKEYAKSKLFRPRTRSVIRKNEASAAIAYLSSQDVVSISAEDDSNELDKLTAEIGDSLLNQALIKQVAWFQTVIGAYQTAQIYGECVSYQYWDTVKNKLCIELIPPENFRIDPAADWIDPINSSPYLIQLIPMYVMDVHGNLDWFEVDDKTMLSASNEYYDSTRMQRERTDTKSSNDAQITDYNVVWVRRIIVRRDGKDWLFYTLGGEFLLSEPMLLINVHWHGERPFVMGSCVIEAFKPHPAGVPELIADTQQEINDLCNQRMDNVKLALNKRYFAKRTAQVDLRSITRNVAGSVTLMNDPATDVIVHSTPDITSSSFQEQDRLNLDFDDLAGAFSGSSVQANRRLNETVGGMEMMSSGANQVAEYQLKTFNETWAEPVLRMALKIILMYESDTELLMSAAGKSEIFQKYGFQSISEEMLSGRFALNVNVGTGAANPEAQVKQFFYGLQTLAAIDPGIVQKINTEEVIKEVFGKLGYKDGKRFFNLEDGESPEAQAAQQAAQELQQAQTDKLKAEAERLKGLANESVANVANKNMQTIFSGVQSGAAVATQPGVIPISDELMKSAGFVDQNGAPITEVVNGQVNQAALPPQNTSPQFPPVPQQPDSAIEGIETMTNE